MGGICLPFFVSVGQSAVVLHEVRQEMLWYVTQEHDFRVRGFKTVERAGWAKPLRTRVLLLMVYPGIVLGFPAFRGFW
jgi:hypothetical protein